MKSSVHVLYEKKYNLEFSFYKYCNYKVMEALEALGNFKKLWEVLGSSGKLWEALGSSGKLWEALGSSGKP